MNNDKLSFLDIEILIENNCAVLYNYSKFEGSEIYQEYQISISPRAFKLTLTDEGHRMRNSRAIIWAIHLSMKANFISNNYPETIIDSRINEVVSWIFEKKRLSQKPNSKTKTKHTRKPSYSENAINIISSISNN